QRRAETGAFLTAGHAGADEAQALFLERLFAADRVGPQRVAAIDDDVVLVEQRHQAVNDGVRRLAGLDEDDDLAGLRQGLDELLQRLAADQPAGRGRVFGDELVGLLGRTVVHRDLETVVRDI